MDHQKQIALELDGDSLADPAQSEHPFAFDFPDGRIRGAQDERARQANPLQALATDEGVQSLDVDDYVRKFRHRAFIVLPGSASRQPRREGSPAARRSSIIQVSRGISPSAGGLDRLRRGAGRDRRCRFTPWQGEGGVSHRNGEGVGKVNRHVVSMRAESIGELGQQLGEVPLPGGQPLQAPFQAGYLLEALPGGQRSEEHTSELQSLAYLVCRLLLEKKKKKKHFNVLHKKKTNKTKTN